MLAVVGHRPSRADDLRPFATEYPLLAAVLGLAPDPDRNAEGMVAMLQSLAASTRVDAA